MKLWACQESHLQAYLELEEQFMARHPLEASASSEPSEILTIEDGVARIAIRGTLKSSLSMFDRVFGNATTYGSIQQALIEVINTPSVSTVVLDVNSPGGTVDGVDQVWQKIRGLQNLGKRVVAVNHGLMASAAYWIASAADEIVAASPVSMTGSIGVQIVAYDTTEADARDGVKRIKIVSSHAPNKNPDISTEEGRASYQEELDAIEQIFLSRVATGRRTTIKNVIEKFGKGGLLVASTPDERPSALSTGMIDSVVGDFGVDFFAKSGKQVAAEEKTMNLAEFLAANPTEGASIESRVIAAEQQGAATYRAKIAQAIAVLSGDFPVFLKKMAEDVVAEKTEPAMLLGAMAMYASTQESRNEHAAVEETAQVGPTPAAPVSLSTDGVVRSEEDYKAAVARARRDAGLEETK